MVTGEHIGNAPTQGMPTHRKLRHTYGRNQVEGIFQKQLPGIDRCPTAATMTTEIGHNNAVMIGQGGSNMIPGMGVCAETMQDEQRRQLRITPITIMESQAIDAEGVFRGQRG